MTIDEIQIGDSYTATFTVKEKDIIDFAAVTGDHNPIHTNEDFAKRSGLEHKIAHGMLSGGFISAVIGMNFPGPGTLYLSQSLQFTAPVYIGDTVTVTVEAVQFIMDRLDSEKRKSLVLQTVCTKKDISDKLIVTLVGEAQVIPPEK